MTQLHDLTALQQAAAVRSGELSPVELVDHYLARVDRLSEDVGAFITVTDELARKQALVAQTQLGKDDLPPLFGVPTAIKDLNATAGIRTTFGSAVMRDNVPEVSDEVVLRMEGAGLISLGKTNTPEFGSPCYTEPDVAPPARTPWDLTRMAGGSSGGAGSAVAAGLVPIAQGSDGGGSVRIPASCCGLFGIKPTRGRVSGAPMYGDVVGLSSSGPLARTVRDAAALLDVMAGRATGDPFWAPSMPEGESFLGWCDRPPGRLRIGRFRTPMIGHAAVHDEVVAGYDRTSALLESLGHQVEDIDPPMTEEVVPTFTTCWSVMTALTPVPPRAEHLLRPLTRWLAGQGHAVTGPQFAAAVGELRRFAARALAQLAPYDIVLTPTLAQPPLPVGAIRDDADPARDFENQKAFTPWTSVWNVTGMPAVSVPLHWTPEGLPVGMMLAARPAEEHLLVALSAQLEEASPWLDRRPACW